jgi:hypothetical protein
MVGLQLSRSFVSCQFLHFANYALASFIQDVGIRARNVLRSLHAHPAELRTGGRILKACARYVPDLDNASERLAPAVISFPTIYGQCNSSKLCIYCVVDNHNLNAGSTSKYKESSHSS